MPVCPTLIRGGAKSVIVVFGMWSDLPGQAGLQIYCFIHFILICALILILKIRTIMREDITSLYGLAEIHAVALRTKIDEEIDFHFNFHIQKL